MLKKTATLFLALLLIFSVSMSALAAGDNMDSRLKAVTIAVKDKLDIGDTYTEFYGEWNDNGYLQYWNLHWNSSEGNLDVYVKEDGTIIQYSRNKSSDNPSHDSSFSPTFPTVSRDKAEKAALAFLSKVLAKNESVVFNASNTIQPVDADRYYFNGILQKNGLKTPDSVSVTVYASDLSIAYFSRGDMLKHYEGDLPSPTPTLSKTDATGLLTGKVKLNLNYVPTGDGKAVLRYVPVYAGSYIVDALSGKLINIDDLYSVSPYNKGSGSSGKETAASDSSLTPVEQSGISKIEGVQQKDALDKAVRSITCLGIGSGYTLSSANYNLNTKTGEVSCMLSYSMTVASAKSAGISDSSYSLLKQKGYNPVIYKNITVDGKTGKLINLYTTYSNFGDSTAKSQEDPSLSAKAEAFLQDYYADQYAQCGRYDTNVSQIGCVTQQTYTYARKTNGYFFPTDYLAVSVNAKTGTIDSFYSNWTDKITFDDANGLISGDSALQTYLGSQDITLSYIALPVKSESDHKGGVEPYGISYVYQLYLAYSLENSSYVSGIDAKTGKIISYDSGNSQTVLSYSDLNGSYAKTQIETLAKYGIGYKGRAFQPTAKLTQLDMLLLLVSANGTYYDKGSMTDSDVDALYNTAYTLNILTRADRDPGRLITRSSLVKTIVSMSGYGKAAGLKGIYKCGFADDNQISAEDYGYVAIAKGLGIIRGNAENKFMPGNITTRQDAAIMLYNFMARNQKQGS